MRRRGFTRWLMSIGVAAAFPHCAWSSDVCDLRGFEAIDVAQKNGFAFTAERADGDGSCWRNGTAFGVAASSESDVVCRISLFASRTMNSTWRLKTAEFSHEFTYDTEPYVGSNNALLIVRVAVPQNHEIGFTLRELRIEGPDCKDWKEAFESPAENEANNDDDEGT